MARTTSEPPTSSLRNAPGRDQSAVRQLLAQSDHLPYFSAVAESIRARQSTFESPDTFLQPSTARSKRNFELSHQHIYHTRSLFERTAQPSLTVDSSLGIDTYKTPTSPELARRAFYTQVARELDPTNHPSYQALQRRIQAEQNWQELKGQAFPTSPHEDTSSVLRDAPNVIAMAAVKKYEGLPDLDLGTEIYEVGGGVPELTEASTLRSDSDVEDANAEDRNVDRRVLDREAARRRFEPAIVDARNANFGDTIVHEQRRDYRTGHRRRHRRRVVEARNEDEEEYSEISDDDETLKAKLARLKREAEEVKAELARMEGGADENEIEFKDSVEQQSHEQKEQTELQGDVRDLSRVLDILSAKTRQHSETLEEEFTRNLNAPQTASKTSQQTQRSENPSTPHLQAIASFSDRLTTLESLLGISPLQPTSTSYSILPTLTTLTSQIQTLHATLAPHPSPLTSQTSTSTMITSTTHLDPLSSRLQTLLAESNRLESSRRSAQKAFEELLETRDRHTHLFQHSSMPQSSTSPTQSHAKAVQPTSEKNDTASSAQQQISGLFLDTQSARIQSLHALLPQIQALQPLLPTVLERLRALSIVHEGAAEARAEMDEVEGRLATLEAEQKKWRDSVEGLEKEVAQSRSVMGTNVKTIGDMVNGLEASLQTLRRQS